MTSEAGTDPKLGDRWIRRTPDISTQRALRSTTRAGIYEHLRRAGQGLTVRDIADAFDLHPNVARTHLETLADAGLVVVSSRKHPGGGRPAKVYLARDEIGPDEIRLEPVATSTPEPTMLLRLLGEVIVSANGGPASGRLEAVRQAANREGGRLLEGTDEPVSTLREAAECVARTLRSQGYMTSVHRADDREAVLARLGGFLDPLRPVRGGLAAAIEWGLLTGAFARVWRSVQLSPVAAIDGTGPPGWVARPAPTGQSGARLAVDIAARLDARGAPRETGVVRAMRTITALDAGSVLEVLTGGPGSPAAFARWADRAGHELIGVERATDDGGRPAIRLLIRKGRT